MLDTYLFLESCRKISMYMSESILSLFSFLGLVSFFFVFVPPLFKVWFLNCSQAFHFVHIWSCLNFSWFLGLNFSTARSFHFVEISCCREFWFEFLQFCFFLYICSQSQVFCFIMTFSFVGFPLFVLCSCVYKLFVAFSVF